MAKADLDIEKNCELLLLLVSFLPVFSITCDGTELALFNAGQGQINFRRSRLIGNPKQIAKKEPGLENVPEMLRSGEIARHSGLYKLQHDTHVVDKEIFIRKGTIVPACHDCGKPLTFVLVRKVAHIDEDPDFQ